jgi:hypothetical protein
LNRKLYLFLATAGIAVLSFAPSRLSAQAFTLPHGVGAVTLSWQYVDNLGHLLSDGYFVERGQSATMSVLFEVDYGVTDRLAATIAIPYVWARYTGSLPPMSNLPLDSCRCWHSSFQDFSLAVRYRFGNDRWAVTPLVRYIRPSHSYAYRGEAVVGRNLEEAQFGVAAGLPLTGLLPRATVQAGYSYAFVEPVLDINLDRSNGFVSLGYAVTTRLYAYAGGIWQRTHGGVRFGSVTGDPFPPPGEANTPARLAERDRILRVNYWQISGGLSYSAGPVDIFSSVTRIIWGTDSHRSTAYTLGASWYFDLLR